MTAVNDSLSESMNNTKLQLDQAYFNNFESDKENNQFLLQFKQLKSYYNFRRIFKESLKRGKCLFPIKNNDNKAFQKENSFVQNEFCLIDKKWLEQWRNHVGYDLIHKELKIKKINRDLIDNDYYELIKLIIQYSSKENFIFPLNNKNIYKKNSNIIDPRAEFEIINEECYKNFVFGNFEEKTHDSHKNTHKPVKFLKEKYLIMLDTENLMTYLINTKVHSLNNYFEILIEFEENKEGRKKTLDYFEETDIDQWIKDLNFDLMKDLEKEFNLFDCKFKLFNKTLSSYMNNTSSLNCVNPNLDNNREQILMTFNRKISDKIK